MDLNRDGRLREYILVKISERFNTVILPRVNQIGV